MERQGSWALVRIVRLQKFDRRDNMIFTVHLNRLIDENTPLEQSTIETCLQEAYKYQKVTKICCDIGSTVREIPRSKYSHATTLQHLRARKLVHRTRSVHPRTRAPAYKGTRETCFDDHGFSGFRRKSTTPDHTTPAYSGIRRQTSLFKCNSENSQGHI